jgi:hypothetical protein
MGHPAIGFRITLYGELSALCHAQPQLGADVGQAVRILSSTDSLPKPTIANTIFDSRCA